MKLLYKNIFLVVILFISVFCNNYYVFAYTEDKIKVAVVSIKNSVPDEIVAALFKKQFLIAVSQNKNLQLSEQKKVDELQNYFLFDENNPAKISQTAHSLDVDYLIAITITKLEYVKGDCYLYLTGNIYNNSGDLRTTIDVIGKSEKLNDVFDNKDLTEENIIEAINNASNYFSNYLANTFLATANVLFVNKSNNTVGLQLNTENKINIGSKLTVFSDLNEEIATLETIKIYKTIIWGKIKWVKDNEIIFPNQKAVVSYNPFKLEKHKKKFLTEKQSRAILTILGIGGAYIYIQNHNKHNPN